MSQPRNITLIGNDGKKVKFTRNGATKFETIEEMVFFEGDVRGGNEGGIPVNVSSQNLIKARQFGDLEDKNPSDPAELQPWKKRFFNRQPKDLLIRKFYSF